MKNKTARHYLFVLALLAFQAANTIYKLGGTIGHSEQLTYLQNEEIQLKKELALIKENQDQAKSLTGIAQESQNEYQAISSTITFSLNNTVASR